MDWAVVLKVVHALLGVWLIVGIVGRWTTMIQASRASTIASVKTLLGLSDRFEKMAIQGSLLVLVFGVLTAIAQGRPFLGPLQTASVDWLFVSLVLYLSLIPIVPLIFLPRGRRFAAALDDATHQGQVTPALSAAFRDPVVFAAHVYELAIIVVIFVLMITKPF
jgi:hypothetical protein